MTWRRLVTALLGASVVLAAGAAAPAASTQKLPALSSFPKSLEDR